MILLAVICLLFSVLAFAEMEKNGAAASANAAKSYPILSYFHQCIDESFLKVKTGMPSEEVRKLMGGEQYMPAPKMAAATRMYGVYRFSTDRLGTDEVLLDVEPVGINDFFISEKRALQVQYDDNSKVVDSSILSIEKRYKPVK